MCPHSAAEESEESLASAMPRETFFALTLASDVTVMEPDLVRKQRGAGDSWEGEVGQVVPVSQVILVTDNDNSPPCCCPRRQTPDFRNCGWAWAFQRVRS